MNTEITLAATVTLVRYLEFVPLKIRYEVPFSRQDKDICCDSARKLFQLEIPMTLSRSGGGCQGSHGVLQDVQVQPRRPGRRRHAPDAPEAVRRHVEAGHLQEVQHRAGRR